MSDEATSIVEVEHTAGPWASAPTGLNMREYAQPFAVCQEGERNLICGVFGDVKGGEEVAAANARVIAAAPELLVQAKIALRYLMDAEHIVIRTGAPFPNGLPRVIAKAHGQSDPKTFLDRETRLFLTAPQLRTALARLLDRYVSLVNCGDCGNWNPETETEVIAARAALAKSAAV